MAEKVFINLAPQETAQLEASRAVIAAHVPDHLRADYHTPEGKLSALNHIVAARSLQPYDANGINALGTVLGDVFVQTLGMRWTRVQDEFGTTIALRYQDTSVVLAPIDAIAKREDELATLDFFHLYNTFGQIVMDLVEQGM
ncbi:DUF3806 domain-containing protein [Pseudooceanicola sp. MF1-13]|uniref:DUF3806 domain-containing protein n=1 Tax=Pseudooceanicola sp. MF1-13 TaxID=3379095 RepID=UPI003892C2AF